MAIRDDVIKALESLPDSATADDIADQVYLVLLVEGRLRELDEGTIVSEAEARNRLKSWLK